MENQNKKQRLDVMLDMETVSLKENAGILSMALVPFHLSGEKCEHEEKYWVIDLATCYMAGMDMNGCQDWWSQQDALARNAVTVQDGKVSVSKAVKEAYDYLSSLCETYEVCIWSQGMDFDLPKLEWCFRTFMEAEPPYHYYNKRDARTYVKESGFDKSTVEFVGTKHHALHDAKHQVECVMIAFSVLHPERSFKYQYFNSEIQVFDDNGNRIG